MVESCSSHQHINKLVSREQPQTIRVFTIRYKTADKLSQRPAGEESGARYFSREMVETKNGAKRQMKIGLTFIRWTQRRLQWDDHTALCLLHDDACLYIGHDP